MAESSQAALDNQARQIRRLHLHIPNSHPRATSPRSSPRASPVSRTSTPTQDGDDIDVSTQGRERHTDARNQAEQVDRNRSNYFRASVTSGESSRDFLARERTYFSWLRLSALLAIASVALFLRLRLPTIDESIANLNSIDYSRKTSSPNSSASISNALIRKAIRKQFIYQGAGNLTYSVSRNLFAATMSLARNDTARDPSLLVNPVFSKVLGSLFFVLAVVSLLVGHIDYMKCERALEEADKLLEIAHLMGQSVEEEGEQIRVHSARSAKRAHSSFFVHVVEVIIALTVFATAIIILVTVTQGNIKPSSINL